MADHPTSEALDEARLWFEALPQDDPKRHLFCKVCQKETRNLRRIAMKAEYIQTTRHASRSDVEWWLQNGCTHLRLNDERRSEPVLLLRLEDDFILVAFILPTIKVPVTYRLLKIRRRRLFAFAHGNANMFYAAFTQRMGDAAGIYQRDHLVNDEALENTTDLSRVYEFMGWNGQIPTRS